MVDEVPEQAHSSGRRGMRDWRLTIRGGAVDVQPRFLHQVPADIQVAPGGGEVQNGPAVGTLGFTKVRPARHFCANKQREGN